MQLLKSVSVTVSLLLISSVCFVKGDDSACWAAGGRCQYTSESCFSYRTGLCAGPANRKCCVSGSDLRCWRIGGICKNNWNSCSGGYIKGLCGGGLSRQCCA
ncbi:lysozyme 1-like [Crassostrea angulata]|uniref:Uncharacterized protein n=2 Tax=Magallana gigas TaxID=29159 RepID=A0A8W8IIA9_MAGGI|nr:lysozyme 1-like [Crassostrea gigas]XP_052706630.1 lysozyme 1-like [Crassostrea angulata]